MFSVFFNLRLSTVILRICFAYFNDGENRDIYCKRRLANQLAPFRYFVSRTSYGGPVLPVLRSIHSANCRVLAQHNVFAANHQISSTFRGNNYDDAHV